MSRIKYLLIALLFITGIAMAQSTANYTYTTSTTGSLVDMSSGTTDLLTALTYHDDDASAVTGTGFTFYFMGIPLRW